MKTPVNEQIRLPQSSVIEGDSGHQVGWLEGQLLVATPQVQGDIFSQSVIYIFVHSADGASGIIVNKPLEQVTSNDVLAQLKIDASPTMRTLAIMHGGPVEEQRGFLLHTNDVTSEHSLVGEHGICVSASASMLELIAQGSGPRQRLLMLGYAGWSAGQLEAEMANNSWISVPATPELVFHADDEEKWSLSAASLGVDMGRFSTTAGHA
ncbi:MAG: YqgE/AlgH family protein [Rickettsiales bacterium]|nr:YqgE/AlgH family protein [Rickettsiales bacterium]